MQRRILMESTVSDAYQLINGDPLTIRKDAHIDELLIMLAKNTKTRHAYVVDKDMRLIGAVRLNDLLSYLSPAVVLQENKDFVDMARYFQYAEAEKVEDLMTTNCGWVMSDMSIKDTLSIMKLAQINEIPVVNEKAQVIGEINLIEIVQHYMDLKTNGEL